MKGIGKIQFVSYYQLQFSSKVLKIIGKSHILTAKNNDNWAFLIFFAMVFPLELETRLYCLSISIMTDTSPAQMGCSRTQQGIL